MKQSFQAAMLIHRPDIVFVLGKAMSTVIAHLH